MLVGFLVFPSTGDVVDEESRPRTLAFSANIFQSSPRRRRKQTMMRQTRRARKRKRSTQRTAYSEDWNSNSFKSNFIRMYKKARLFHSQTYLANVIAFCNYHHKTRVMKYLIGFSGRTAVHTTTCTRVQAIRWSVAFLTMAMSKTVTLSTSIAII